MTKVQDVRQVRPDHMVEVKLGGRWYLACECNRQLATVLPSPVRVGEYFATPVDREGGVAWYR